MKKISLVTFVALAVLLVAALTPAVSAELLSDSGSKYETYTVTKNPYYKREINRISINDIAEWRDLYFLYCRAYVGEESIGTLNAKPYYEMPVTLKIGSTIVGSGTAHYNALYSGTSITGVQVWIDFDNFDIQTYTGSQKLSIIPSSGTLFNGIKLFIPQGTNYPASPTRPIGFVTTVTTNNILMSGTHIAKSRYQWFNELTDTGDAIEVKRLIDGVYYQSNLTVVAGGQTLTDTSNQDKSLYYLGTGNWYVTTPQGKVFTGVIGSSSTTEPSTEPSVIVYVKNSQTGALIADANIVIDARVNGEYYPVVNRTEPSGIFSITLQPTGGGHPNPDGYRLIATADGYNNPMPEINFTVDDYKLSLYCLLDPIAGGPENENKIFIDFFVSDMYANPISGATVKFGKYTLITNSMGYTVFEVDKSNNYTWIVSKSGYGPLTGNAVIGDAPRHTINTVLAPTVTPTKPTPTQPSTSVSPTPIMTAPTGEPVSNWFEWFAAHFGMILGGGVEIGKIFMWLCFTVPVGVYVGKEAKAGAAGFMAGAGVVTLFFVLIGWVPIWIVVLLALIIGLLYAKVFNTPDNGGGR